MSPVLEEAISGKEEGMNVSSLLLMRVSIS